MTWSIQQGDVLDRLREMPDESVQCCVTSPPYWGLRRYIEDGAPEKPFEIGLEATPDEHVAKLVEVFREVRRVLRTDGTLWLNLGDSYANTGAADSSKVGGFTGDRIRNNRKGIMDSRPRGIPSGLKPKDLVGIPWRVAFALQADGWWLRQDIVWSKPNPMPESVTDRCTKAHEYIFLLAKSERYYYDAQAIAEKAMHAPSQEWVGGRRTVAGDSLQQVHPAGSCHTLGDGITRNKRSVWTVATQPYPEAHFATYPPNLIEPCILAGCPADGTVLDPFGGSGTTAAVAVKHGRSAVLCELNPAYAQLAERRVREQLDGVGLFVGE